MTFHLDTKTIVRSHVQLYGVDPTPVQMALYEAYPRFRGYTQHPSAIEAVRGVIHLALMQCMPSEPATEAAQPSFILYPLRLDEIVWGQVQEMGRIVFARLKGAPTESRKAASRLVGSLFKSIRFGKGEIPDTAERWVVYGYDPKDAIPAWVSKGLLEV